MDGSGSTKTISYQLYSTVLPCWFTGIKVSLHVLAKSRWPMRAQANSLPPTWQNKLWQRVGDEGSSSLPATSSLGSVESPSYHVTKVHNGSSDIRLVSALSLRSVSWWKTKYVEAIEIIHIVMALCRNPSQIRNRVRSTEWTIKPP